MDDYAGRVLADRYRLPLPPSDAYELVETRAFDTYSGQEVLVRQVPLPEVVDAEVLDADGRAYGAGNGHGGAPRKAQGRATRRPNDPAVRRAIEAAQAAAQIPDHPRLDQVFDVFAEAGSLWIVSELIPARPLAALLAERPLDPYRAAEIASDLLTALRVLHAHGWTHRNITTRTVLICDDGRVVLTGLAAGAAEEALCGYTPIPSADHGTEPEYDDEPEAEAPYEAGPEYEDPSEAEPYEDPSAYDAGDLPAARSPYAPVSPYAPYAPAPAPDAPAADSVSGSDSLLPVPRQTGSELEPVRAEPAGGPPSSAADVRAARAGAIAAYRAGARAAARISETRAALPAQPNSEPDSRPESQPDSDAGGRPPGPPAPADGAPEPQWWAEAAADDEDDDGGGDDEYGPGPGRVMLAGTWSDGPHVSRDGAPPVPAGGGLPARVSDADPARLPGRWEEVVAAGGPPPAYRGPATPLAAERARQARIALVGPVTERWAPEQAGPVHENWQLAPPIGPATDLWALGALLYRAVQGHAPYPEDSAVELVQLVCAEPPAFAEECGPLRPVVESLLRQDPTERPDFEELRGWLRSLIRSAPEPEAGAGAVPLPPDDPTRLPIVRRRGELVRKRRGRHKKGKEAKEARGGRQSNGQSGETRRAAAHVHADEQEFHEELPQYAAKPLKAPKQPKQPKQPRAARPPRAPRPPRTSGSPRALGRVLLLLVLLLLGGAVAYAFLFMPGQGEEGGAAAPGPQQPQQSEQPQPPQPSPTPTPTPTRTPPPQQSPAPDLAPGYRLHKDPEGFQVAVAKGWKRSGKNADGQIRFTSGDFTLLVVPGRDTVQAGGSDPMAYQRTKERELQPWRESSWSGATGLRRIDVGRQAMAEGQFTWQDDDGRDLYVRNLALIVNGRYHVVQVIGPDAQRDKVSEVYQQAVKAYSAAR
ncbi:protein kinase [Streptomyces sp. NPDC048604]|uniref:protein kinase n=1 Tax=Streptomyces sp. NPDC048604 TaxID=3365578 RepID=UPI003718B84B